MLVIMFCGPCVGVLQSVARFDNPVRGGYSARDDEHAQQANIMQHSTNGAEPDQLTMFNEIQ